MPNLAPIVLFIYNRPDHTARTLASLAGNALATETDLVIYADGPKKPEHMPSVEAARAVARAARGFKSVRMIDRERNLGLANSIINGVTEACDTYGRAIVVEDDLFLSPAFLSFMNAGLDCYQREDRVMQISGYMFPVAKPDDLPPSFFCRLSPSWGWATWREAWRFFEPDTAKLLQRIDERGARAFDLDGAYPYREMLEQQSKGTLDVWGARWYASMFLRDGLCLYPARSLVNNIGMDGSGEHCGPSTAYDVALWPQAPTVFPSTIELSVAGETAIKNFFRDLRRPSFKSIAGRFGRSFRRIARGRNVIPLRNPD
jgi:hypothetical protein